MSIFWVEPANPLPDPALSPSSGMIAAGMDLTLERLLEAYRKGMFPWFGPGDPVLWWSPDPRTILKCRNFKISRSLAKRIRQFNKPDGQLRISMNLAFSRVIAHCAHREVNRIGVGALRKGHARPASQPKGSPVGTWITPEIMHAYGLWHDSGQVHSIETWVDDELVGGLYGVCIGQCFFGESMFSLAPDASKVALAYLIAYLRTHGIDWLDCQQDTPHMRRLGAEQIDRAGFLAMLAKKRDKIGPRWGKGRLLADGQLLPDNASA